MKVTTSGVVTAGTDPTTLVLCLLPTDDALFVGRQVSGGIVEVSVRPTLDAPATWTGGPWRPESTFAKTCAFFPLSPGSPNYGERLSSGNSLQYMTVSADFPTELVWFVGRRTDLDL